MMTLEDEEDKDETEESKEEEEDNLTAEKMPERRDDSMKGAPCEQKLRGEGKTEALKEGATVGRREGKLLLASSGKKVDCIICRAPANGRQRNLAKQVEVNNTD